MCGFGPPVHLEYLRIRLSYFKATVSLLTNLVVVTPAVSFNHASNESYNGADSLLHSTQPTASTRRR